MNHTTSFQVVAVVIGLGISACGLSTPREGAKMLAAYTSNIKDKLSDSAQKRSELNANRERNVQLLENAASAAEENNSTALAAFKIAAQPTASVSDATLFDAIRNPVGQLPAATGGTTSLAESVSTAAPPLPGKTDDEARAESLATTAKDLSQLAETPSIAIDTQFYVLYGQSVKQSIDESKKKANSNTKASLAAVQQKNAEVQQQIGSTVGARRETANGAIPAGNQQ